MFISFLLGGVAKEKKRTKEKKTDAIKKHSKYFQNKFCIHSITFQAVKIYFKNKLCLIKVTTAKPYYAFGVQGNLAIPFRHAELLFDKGNVRTEGDDCDPVLTRLSRSAASVQTCIVAWI